MAVDHSRDRKRKATGGRKRAYRGKRKFNAGSLPAHPIIGEKRMRVKDSRGRTKRVRTLSIEFANVMDKSTKKSKKVKILNTTSNPADRNFPRRNILTKGAEIDTELGKAVITSRPSRDGVANAVLIHKK